MLRVGGVLSVREDFFLVRESRDRLSGLSRELNHLRFLLTREL